MRPATGPSEGIATLSEQKPVLRLAITCMVIVLGSAFIGAQLSTSGGLGQLTSGIVEEDDASRDDSASGSSSGEDSDAEAYVGIDNEDATDEAQAPEGTLIFVDEDSELGRALAEAG